MTDVKFRSAAFDFARIFAEHRPSDEEAMWAMFEQHRETIIAALDQAALRETRAAKIERNPGDWALVEIAVAMDEDGCFGVGTDDDFGAAAGGLSMPVRCCVVEFHMRIPNPKRYELAVQDDGEDDGEIVESTPLTERLPTDIA